VRRHPGVVPGCVGVLGGARWRGAAAAHRAHGDGDAPDWLTLDWRTGGRLRPILVQHRGSVGLRNGLCAGFARFLTAANSVERRFVSGRSLMARLAQAAALSAVPTGQAAGVALVSGRFVQTVEISPEPSDQLLLVRAH
jgi:hypothetical protein